MALTPAARRWWMTPVHPELSANAPWTSATVGADGDTTVASAMVISSRVGGRERSGGEEGEQVGVELLLVRPGQPVRGTRVDLVGRVLHDLAGLLAGRHDG